MRVAPRSSAFIAAVLWSAATAGAVLASTTATAAGPGIEVLRAEAEPSLAGAPSGTAVLTLHNAGPGPDHLTAAASPVAGSVELHRMTMQGEVMSMRRVDRLPIAAGATVRIDEDAGLHLMLIGLKRPLKPGDTVPLTLTFDKAGRVESVLRVRSATPAHP